MSLNDSASPSSSADSSMPEVAGVQRPDGDRPSVNGWKYFRWSLWLLLLAGAIGLWILSRFQPGFSDSLAHLVAQLQESSLSQSQRDAELAAAKVLRKSGALVIFEGPQQGVTSVHFTNPKALSEESLTQLAMLVRLNSLNLTGMPITDEQLVYVAKVRSLASLVLNETPIADGGLAHLAPLEQLEVLHLRKTAVTDAGLAHLAALPNLKVLDLSETQVTDQGLAELAKLKDLRWLLLDGDAVTDAGLKHLELLPQLGQLNLRDTRVTKDGIDQLKKALPSLHVEHR
ncbi:MAG TPA: hypothetical protein PK777_11170 [Thermoguttaceae bacterium]|nr:hypothetical protein [Thermoguttaceae bacterium]